ncbi:XkdX family protein [Bacillus tequilensis]|uniref:XkdX family protein n=1 Tax=Bacillus tequilensis TaxID=227866 RepID=A0A6H0WH70_9BACI|nr:XkdX family protein [Bacillus tequilensis]QIW79504.1 XkdX family protein [Bacillus tequilensis]
MNLNFWVYALFYKWATISMIKDAMTYSDCSIDDLKKGVATKYVSHDQYKEITGQTYEETIKVN